MGFEYRAARREGVLETVRGFGGGAAPLRAHLHAEIQVTRCLAGACLFEVAGVLTVLSVGDALVIGPNTPHRGLGGGAGAGLFRSDYWDSAGWRPPVGDAGGRAVLAPAADVRSVQAAIAALDRGLNLAPPLEADRRRRFGRALALLAEGASLLAAAEVCGLSADGFGRAFRRAFGLSPYAYIKARRLAAARTALRQGVAPAMAAIDAGFSDQSHLTRDFRAHYGIAPGAYRRLHGVD